ncbi:hypothetical protein [Rhizobium leguminosarum]|uniref:hypothetical protein n=1 Tax=Rhizobium leguminosarum TaxID=384 RepID=UPI0002E16B2C|nr:hypothetical protein [Rhizobium leguminosarum]
MHNPYKAIADAAMKRVMAAERELDIPPTERGHAEKAPPWNRRSDIARIQWDWVDYRKNNVTITTKKGNKLLVLPITPMLREALDATHIFRLLVSDNIDKFHGHFVIALRASLLGEGIAALLNS